MQSMRWHQGPERPHMRRQVLHAAALLDGHELVHDDRFGPACLQHFLDGEFHRNRMLRDLLHIRLQFLAQLLVLLRRTCQCTGSSQRLSRYVALSINGHDDFRAEPIGLELAILHEE